MQFYKPFALFSLIPLSFFALSNWEAADKKTGQFLLVAVEVLAVSRLLYRINQNYWQSIGYQIYSLGEQMLAAFGIELFQTRRDD